MNNNALKKEELEIVNLILPYRGTFCTNPEEAGSLPSSAKKSLKDALEKLEKLDMHSLSPSFAILVPLVFRMNSDCIKYGGPLTENSMREVLRIGDLYIHYAEEIVTCPTLFKKEISFIRFYISYLQDGGQYSQILKEPERFCWYGERISNACIKAPLGAIEDTEVETKSVYIAVQKDLGMAYIRNGDREKAIESFKRGIKMFRKSPISQKDALSSFNYFLMATGIYTNFISQDPSNIHNKKAYQRGTVYLNKGTEFFLKNKELIEDGFVITKKDQFKYGLNDCKQAVEAVDYITKMYLCGQIDAYFNKGRRYIGRTNPKLAKKYLQKGFEIIRANCKMKSLSKDPFYYRIGTYYVYMGQYLMIIQNYEKASKYFWKILHDMNNEYNPYFEKGEAYKQAKLLYEECMNFLDIKKEYPPGGVNITSNFGKDRGPDKLSDSYTYRTRVVKEKKAFEKRKAEVKCKWCRRYEPDDRKFQLCGGCKSVHYCSVECQRNDWKKSHKKLCKKQKTSISSVL